MSSSKEALSIPDQKTGFTSFVKKPGEYIKGVKERIDPEVLVNSGVISTLNRGVIGLEMLATPFIYKGVEHIDPKQRMIIAGTAMIAGLITTSCFELKTLRSKKNSSPNINTNFYRVLFGGSALAGVVAARIHGVATRVANPNDFSAMIAGFFVVNNSAPLCATTLSAAVIGTTASVLINKYYREDRMGMITDRAYPFVKKSVSVAKESARKTPEYACITLRKAVSDSKDVVSKTKGKVFDGAYYVRDKIMPRTEERVVFRRERYRLAPVNAEDQLLI